MLHARALLVLFALAEALAPSPAIVKRRAWLEHAAAACAALGGAGPAARAKQDDSLQFSLERPDLDEVSGLTVLRVAEVCQFQETLLREVAKGVSIGVPVTGAQFSFGTQILLRNTNLDGNMRLMIDKEVPRARRDEARGNAVAVMNGLNAIAARADAVDTDELAPRDALELAALYAKEQGQLLALFAYLPKPDQERYEGYARVLGDYEKRVSQGCEGGLTGGCIDEPPPSPPPPDGQLVKPKPGQAPAMLARAIEAAKRNPDAAAPFTPSPAPFTPTSNFAESRPERGSFAAMAAGY